MAYNPTMKKYTAVRVSEDTHVLLSKLKAQIEEVVPSGVNYTIDAVVGELLAAGSDAAVETIEARYAGRERTA